MRQRLPYMLASVKSSPPHRDSWALRATLGLSLWACAYQAHRMLRLVLEAARCLVLVGVVYQLCTMVTKKMVTVTCRSITHTLQRVPQASFQ